MCFDTASKLRLSLLLALALFCLESFGADRSASEIPGSAFAPDPSTHIDGGQGKGPGKSTVPKVERGFHLPAGITLITAKGTGRTTGHIADLSVSNTSDQPQELPSGLIFIPSDGRFQSYVARPQPGHVIPPGATAEVSIEGYCTNVRMPPIPDGEPLPPIDSWLVSSGAVGPVDIPTQENALYPGVALIPGTDIPLSRAIHVDSEPMTAVPLLFSAISAIEKATTDLQESGDLKTPFSANPDREREAVIQQTFWIFAAELENEPYTRDEFTTRLEKQFEESTGVPIAEASDTDQSRLQSGADDFWDAFQLVGAEAKVISDDGGRDFQQVESSEGQASTSPDEVEEDPQNEDSAVANDDQACGSIEGTVSIDPGTLRKAIKNIIVYVDGECDFCPPKPVREPVEIAEGKDGIHPSFTVVAKGTPIKLVNGYDMEIDFAPEFIPSPVENQAPTLSIDAIPKGESTEVTPTKSPSGNTQGDYLLKSRWNKRSDAIVFVTPNQCFAVADENGHYAIGELPPGSYHLKVYTYVRRTYLSEADVVVEEGEITTQDFVLRRQKQAQVEK